MKQQAPRSLTICIDGNEQNDLQFPESLVLNWKGQSALIEVKKRKFRFDTGDYYLEGYKEVCIAERKGSLSELHTNLFTADETRFRKAVRRLVGACAVPILWLDIPHAGLWTPTDYVDDPAEVVDKLLRTVREFGLTFFWVPPATTEKHAKRNGELLIRTMWSVIQSQPLTIGDPLDTNDP